MERDPAAGEDPAAERDPAAGEALAGEDHASSRFPARPRPFLFLFLFLLLLFAAPARADKLILYDGRVVEGCRVEERDGALFAVFPHGTLRLVSSDIEEILRDSSDAYVPRNDYEREQLAKGFVLFEGVWMSRGRREGTLEKRRRETEARLAKARRRLEWESALRRGTQHFTIISNTSRERIERYAAIFEEFYSAFVKRFKIPGKSRVRADKPVIKIYRSRAQYLASGMPARSAGIFFTLKNELRLYQDDADPRYTLDVLFHEGTHLLIHLLRPDFFFPIWVNEGMAEYYGASIVKRDGSIETGVVQEGRLAVLRNAVETGRYIPLETVLLTPQPKFGSLHYAEAWCFVHYLLENKGYASKFKSFFQNLATGTGYRKTRIPAGRGKSFFTAGLPETLDLFKKKMGIASLDGLEQEFKDYALFGLPDVGKRGLVVAARVAMRYGEYDDALEAIGEALEMGSTDPNCRLYEGRIFAIRERYEEAAASYQRAIELAPLNPYFHAELGRVLRESEDPAMMREGIREYHLAVEIAPGSSSFRTMLEKAMKNADLEEIRKRKAKRRGKGTPPAKEGTGKTSPPGSGKRSGLWIPGRPVMVLPRWNSSSRPRWSLS